MEQNTGQIASTDELAQRMAISEVIYSHSRGLDRLDADCLKAAYWPEAEVDYGNFVGNAHQFADLVVVALADGYEMTRHSLANTLIQLSGDTARVESYVTAGHLLQGGREEMVFFGRYRDRLERRGKRWKLIHRRVVMDWSRRHAVEDERSSDA